MIVGVLRADVICDELWLVIEPVLPSGAGRRGRPWNDHRLTLEAIAWRFRTGSPWRDLPADFGAWQSIWERHRRWSTDGTYAAMFAAVRAAPTGGRTGGRRLVELVELISVDSTSVRAHQHAAGGRFHEDGDESDHDPGHTDPGHTGGRIELQESARSSAR
jgi:putative transposase